MSPKQLGRYEITGILGRGTMGVVYQAHDPLIERTVAIKTVGYAGLTPEESEEFEKRFFREAKSAGRLNHPNIVTIHDVGRCEELAYIAMEYLSGSSLRDLLDSGAALPPKRIVEITAAIADGLAFAHANGVIHRDIKPANIMVLNNDIVKIADFGIASLPSGSLTIVGTTLGSPKYMSPEQVVGKRADGRSDIFSLGAVLYEMLTGRAPFNGDDLNAVLYQVLNNAPPLPSSITPGLPHGFDRIVARALSKDPEKRYQNAAEMAADLRNYRRIPGLMRTNDSIDQILPIEAVPDAGAITVKFLAEQPAEKIAPGHGLSYLLYSVPLVVVAVVAGVLLFLPEAPPPPAVTLPASPTVAAPSVPVIEAQPTLTPVAKEPQAPQVSENPVNTAAPATVSTDAGRNNAVKKTGTTNSIRKAAADKTAEQTSEQQAARAPQAATTSEAPAHNWQTALRADLAACDHLSFFQRVFCADKARRDHCSGHWGSIEECSFNKN